MPTHLKIDFVSDISCPWCIIGLRALEEALVRTSDGIDAAITFQPFELNPDMPAEGQNIVEHVAQKYGSTPEQSAANRAMIQARAADLGFTMTGNEQSRIYNSFDAHRLLHWAEASGHQAALKRALFDAYFTQGQNIGDHDVLVAAAVVAGLDPVAVRAVLTSGQFAQEVRAAQQFWRQQGITAVPAVVINDQYLILGGQPIEAFEKALRAIAAEA
ncbi:MAG: disulfide bond formation protein DsbA [Proteobacteria bacterium ST_bin13]|nr:MAG: disulfide bond formation protein DsbA [Proteobacteria bacterium ST_bin13]